MICQNLWDAAKSCTKSESAYLKKQEKASNNLNLIPKGARKKERIKTSPKSV